MQFDIFDSEEIKQKKSLEHDQQLMLLPVHALQEKYGQDEPTLTPCEFQIMHMVLTGYSILEIGLKVFISPAGVKYRLTNVYWKFGVENRLGLIKKTSLAGIQFFIREFDRRTKEAHLTKHTFHNHVNLRAHERDLNENNQKLETQPEKPAQNIA